MLLTLLGGGAVTPSITKKTTFIWIKQGSTWRLTIPNMRISGTYRYVQPYIKVSGNWK
jgi:hypothetical protein